MSNGKRIGYIRVSTIDQNPDRQLDGIQLDKKFIEYATGVNTKRPQLSSLLEYAREDDVIVVHSMDRLARNVKDLRAMIDRVVERGIAIQFIKEKLVFSKKQCPIANLMLTVLGAIAEFEYSLIRERQLEGIAIAQRNGRFKGRKKILDKDKIEILKKELLTRKTKTKIAKEMGISRFTLYRYIQKIEEEESKKHAQ